MKIYFEFILLVNFLLDFMILYGTKRILKINKKLHRLLIASLVASSSTFLVLIKVDNLSLFLFKIFTSIVIILIAFGKNNLFKNLFYFYLISIILGGTMYLFDLNSSYYFNFLILLLVSPLLVYLFVKEILTYKNTYSNKYEVDIYIESKKYSLEGIIDTGNRLVSPLKKEPVILVNLKLKPKKPIYVPYKALNTTGVISCIKPDKVLIKNKEFNHCLIGLSKDKFALEGVSCILPNKFKEEL